MDGNDNAHRPTRFWPRLRMRLFHLYFLFSRPATLGVRALVHDRESDAVLLVRHTYVAGWHLPGGGVEAGETMLSALERELREEANIVAIAAPKLISVHFNHRVSRRDHVALFAISSFRQTAPHVPNREIAEARFFRLATLPEDTSPSTRQRIAEVLSGDEISPYW